MNALHRRIRAATAAAAACVGVLASLTAGGAATTSTGATSRTFVEIGGLSPGAAPARITAGPGGALWFTEPGIDSVAEVTTAGVVTEFPLATPAAGPAGIAAGPDGNVWAVESAVAKVARVTPTGVVTEFPLPAGSDPLRITAGPDGALWYTAAGAHSIGRVTTGGVVTSYPLTSGAPTDITVGPDGNLWFTDTANHMVGRITTSGAISEFSVPGVTAAAGITAGSDGNIWFGEAAEVGRITTGGAVTEFATPTANPGITDVTRGADGNVWFAEKTAVKLGVVTPGGSMAEFAVANSVAPGGLADGADGNLWFTAPVANLIGKAAGGSPATTTTTTAPTSSTSPTTTTSTTTPRATTSTTAAPAATVSRLAGSDRIATAIAVSQAGYPARGSAQAVVVASAFGSFADALAGSPLAAAKGGPLLLTAGSALDPRTLAEIERVLPPGSTVYLLGGTSALAPGVDAVIAAAGYQAVRLAGIDRFATAVEIADAGLGNPATIYEATGLDFADAISGAALAVADHGAILLTDGAIQAPATATYLTAHPGDARTALGGPAAAADPGATPVVGADRWGTSADVAALFPSPTVIGIASGQTPADALTGGAAVGGPMLLVPPSGPLPTSIAAWLKGEKGKVTSIVVYGGTSAVPVAVVGAVTSAL